MALLVPTASQCFTFLGPVSFVWGLFWFMRHGQQVIDRAFPSFKWGRDLGWLNFRAYQRAETMLRAVRHMLHGVLLIALAGILGICWAFGHFTGEDVPPLFVVGAMAVSLAGCLGLWIVYFKTILAPRLQAELEEEELARYRDECPLEDGEEAQREAQKARIVVWDSPRTGLRRNL